MTPPFLATFLANLYRAGIDHMPASIGGGTFSPDECMRVYKHILEAQALLTHFQNNAQAKAPRKRGAGGRPPRLVECIGCDETVLGMRKAVAAGWAVGSRSALCPVCDRWRDKKLAATK